MASHKIGLANVGNTCFLNSVLQALRICPPLVATFLKDPTRTPATRPGTMKGPLMSAFQTLLRDIWTSDSGTTMVPRGFVQALTQTVRDCDDDWYQPRHQADAAECLQYILDSLHDAIYRQVRITIQGIPKSTEETSQVKAMESWGQFFQREYSPIVEHFYGQTQTQIRCESCGTVSERYEPWSTLKLPIPGGDVAGSAVPNMIDCLNAYHTHETIEGYACEKCKTATTAIMSHKISKLPQIMVLSIKRFTNSGAKIRGRIGWDVENMDFQPWMAFSRCPYTNSPTSAQYQTFAVIEHNGSAGGGHYHMFARENMESATWFSYDDSSVREGVSHEEVVSADSYILFMIPVTKKKAMKLQLQTVTKDLKKSVGKEEDPF